MATTANRKNTALTEAMTKTQLLETLSESTGLQRKDVAAVLDELGAVIERHVRKRAVGTFTLPGLLKIKVVRRPATKARKMMSPFTGQEITVAAKPASRAVKVQPLSGLKRMTE
ncbi:MAG: HU family DNA-binding protein [Deltaproteobacteria bacterium]|nr:HU family DNA-binding protein [Deltaproteobacteria bacterium]